MASQGHQTRLQPPPPPQPAREGGLDLTTLLLSAVASAVAAYVTAQIWARGALASAAMSPVIVALVKEGLRKPTEVVTAVVPTRTGRRGHTQESATLPGDLTDQLEAGAPPPYPPPAPGAQAGPVNVYSTRSRRLRWRLAVITGLLGFLVCVVVYTVPEVIAGGSIGRPGHSTTLFSSGSKSDKKSDKGTTSTTTDESSTTPAKTETQPTETVTQTVTTPAPAAQPSQTTPPAATTPATPQTTTPAAPAQGNGAATTPAP
jgi:hypothetical protein